MDTTNLPTLSVEAVGAEEPVVAFVHFECRSCGERSPWMRTEDDDSHYQWGFDHQNRTRHGSYYKWSVGRNTMRVGR